MPTVPRIDGYVIVIYLHDHGPAHVHVFAHGCEGIVDLNCPNGEPEAREFYRCKARDVKDVLRIVGKHQERLCAMWKEIHGKL